MLKCGLLGLFGAYGVAEIQLGTRSKGRGQVTWS